MMQRLSVILYFLALVSVSGCEKNGGSGPGTPPAANTFVNPIMSGSDPWIIQRGNTYYYTHTMGNRIVLWKSTSISQMASAPSVEVFKPVSGQPFGANVWAPELHYLNDKWYMYFTAGTGADETQRTWVLENPAADPTSGTWTMKGRIFAGDTDFWGIDGTVLEYNSQMYFLWSGRPNQSIQDQNIYIAKMQNPWTLEGPSVLLSKPELNWERLGGPVNEAPQVLKNAGGQVFMVYSASGCWTDDYALGMLTLKTGGDPMNAADWTKGNSPVFTKSPAANAFGPGHNAFFKSPDGREDWIMYHANNNSGEGCGEKRNVRIQKFTWNASGVPQFGTPERTGVGLVKPGGE
jgi:GH43 family beta-xylosidase